jgi:hypothetical protein
MQDATYTYAQEYIAPEITQLVEQQQLGQLCKVYKPAHPLKLIAMIIGSLLLLIAIMAVTFFISGGYRALIAFFPIFIIFYAVRTLLRGNPRLYVYTNGLLWVRGKRYEAARWEQIESITRRKGQSRYGSDLTCTIRLVDGRTLKISDTLKAIEQLAMIIQNEFRKVRLPLAIAAFERGEPVTFGKVQVDHMGLSNGKELIPWDQIDNMAIKQGLVVAQKNGRPIKWSKVKESETPNLYVLGSLVDHIVKKK